MYLLHGFLRLLDVFEESNAEYRVDAIIGERQGMNVAHDVGLIIRDFVEDLVIYLLNVVAEPRILIPAVVSLGIHPQSSPDVNNDPFFREYLYDLLLEKG